MKLRNTTRQTETAGLPAQGAAGLLSPRATSETVIPSGVSPDRSPTEMHTRHGGGISIDREDYDDEERDEGTQGGKGKDRARGTDRSLQMAPEQGLENRGNETANITWLYRRSKAELLKIAEICKIEVAGSIHDIRRILRIFLTKHPENIITARCLSITADTPPALPTLRHQNPPTRAPLTFLSPERRIATPRDPSVESLDIATILTQVRKWGCTFDGRDPISFLERLEELRDSYSHIGDDILKGFPEIMKGNALLWYRNQRDSWRTWEDFEADFRRRYLPTEYKKNLRKAIDNRTQKPGERYPDYETELSTLMRRAGLRNEEQKLEQLYDNLLPEYKIFIKRREVNTRAELYDLALQYEQIFDQQNAVRTRSEQRATNARRATIGSAAYDRDSCCWRCKQRGHTRFQCQRPARLFCSVCGKDGILTRRCHPSPGNPTGVEENRAIPRPEQTPQ